MSVVGLDHVQVAAPAGCETAARWFYGSLLGLAEAEKPLGLRDRGGVWFRLSDGRQLHVGVADPFSAAVKAHPALRVAGAAIDGLAMRLVAEGVAVTWDETVPQARRFFSADPFGNRVELLVASDVLVVREGERMLSFSFAEMVAFNGGDSPGGVAQAFQVLSLALSRFSLDGPCQRRGISVRTAFGGPGARDGFELVTRAVSDGRYVVDAGLARPSLGVGRERFVFVVGYQGVGVTLVLREGFVTTEFAELAGSGARSDAEEARLTVLKDELAARVMAVPAGEVYSIE